ncbi:MULTISPECIES: transcription termination factor Rho [Saccharopolyspora]|uniref:Transcription termination factor Rho n=1 Tax=Saccharopolyspora gregorii TaxID=33914 RepID=A0ABP6RJM5_9PSEU|nr:MULTISPECIES: transcription termination factor Rho [Saccharopolyspora]MCA1190839.1 transcription termination factor Rho [Saccharopolyspora sp. 6V]MCA1228463.1 transcription termination factor Rho [Saccharopolyspora sp. 6M]MCA1278834.1 transcription termination factor Rho [Saccharopolyspora sp. 7B]
MSNTELLSSETTNGVSQAGQQESEQPSAGAETNGAPRRRGGLSGMVLAELRQLAGELGIDTSGLRKGDLIAAIKERQGGAPAKPRAAAKPAQEDAPAQETAPSRGKSHQPALDETDSAAQQQDSGSDSGNNGSAPNRGRSRRQQPAEQGGEDEGRRGNRRRRSSNRSGGNQDQGDERGQDRGDRQNDRGDRGDNRDRDKDNNRGDRGGQDRGDRGDRGGQDRGDRQNSRQQQDKQDNRPQDDSDEDGGRRRGRRFRDRRRNRGRAEGGGNEPEVREDDVLLPVAGILDVLENYAFVRTSGYLAGPNDVYVSLSLVRKYGLRRGDAIKGVIRQPRDNEQQRQKFNPLVRVDSINGLEPEASKGRSEFHKLTPLYPNERLRLETEPQNLTGRIIDLVMPVGKGQRALIVSPPKAGKTMVLQAIANAITTNNPECHLMVVLADERPEEVTDMQRSVKGEVIASTFDRPPSDHTTVAELSIERAKRLVEMGHDVVVLLDSITRLGRAYNLAAPASGRILSGGVDSTALYPPKRFLGAARNIENGGSLTIFATALVETGSTMDTVIFEEFKGTGNAELKLDRKLADKRLFPAVDVDASSTRKDEILLAPDELTVTHKLRRVLAALDAQQSLELLQERLRKSRTNIEFLMQVAKNAPGGKDDN